MTYLGKYQIGDAVPLALSSVDGAGVPKLPDSTPTAVIFKQDGSTIETKYLAYTDRPRYGFSNTLVLGSSYEAATATKYHILYSWVISSVTLQESDSFEVAEYGSGQNADGTVYSCRGVVRPGGQWIVYLNANDKLYAGYRPYL